MSIGEVSDSTGLSVHALRFFEREDVFLRRIPRTSGGQRQFDESDLHWLTLCNRFRESGMPLATLKQFAALVRCGPGNESERLDLLKAHEQSVVAKIAELTHNLDVIRTKISIYEEHVANGTAAGVWSPATTAEARA